MLSCIVEDEGGNSLVERTRGKLFRDAPIVNEDEHVSDNKRLQKHKSKHLCEETNENSYDHDLKVVCFDG